MTGFLIFEPSLRAPSSMWVDSGLQGRPGHLFCVPPLLRWGDRHVCYLDHVCFSLLSASTPPPRLLLTPRLHAICRQQLSRTVQSLRASGQLPPLPRHPEPELSPKPRLLINSDLHSAFPSYVFKRRSSQDSEELSISCRGKIDLSFPSSTCS